MNHLVSYCSNEFVSAKKRVLDQATQFGQFTTINQWTYNDIDNNFREEFKEIFKYKKGGGYWVWKPYVITETYKKAQEGDIIIYMDSGCHINSSNLGKKRFNEYIEMLKNSEYGCISFQFTPHENYPEESRYNCPYTVEQATTVREIFDYFDVADRSDIINTGQIIATVIILKKCAHSEFLLNCWLQAARDDYKLFTDEYVENNQDNPRHWGENRHDQSVFSVVRKKHGSIILGDETKFPTGVMPTPEGEHNMLSEGSYIDKYKYPFWACRCKK